MRQLIPGVVADGAARATAMFDAGQGETRLPGDRSAPRYRLTRILVVVWVATWGADRIDFLSGKGPIVLTPFLVLTPVALLAVALGPAWGRRQRVPMSLLVATIGYLTLAIVSVLVNSAYDPGFGRVALLLGHVLGSFLMISLLTSSPLSRALLVRGALVGLALGSAFDVVQLGAGAAHPLSLPFLNFSPGEIGTLTVRLTAQSVDPNRGGLGVAVYLWVLLHQSRLSPIQKGLVVFWCAALVAATLSRSGLLALLIVVIPPLIPLGRGRRAISRSTLVAAVAVLTIGVINFGLPGGVSFEKLNLALANRISGGSESSTGIHLDLIGRGLDAGLNTPRFICCGSGYGSSGSQLQDIFPGNRYANWHSLPISTLVELGALGLLCVGYMVAGSAFRGRRTWALVAAVTIFSLTYDVQAEPIFWGAVFLGWFLGRDRTYPENSVP